MDILRGVRGGMGVLRVAEAICKVGSCRSCDGGVEGRELAMREWVQAIDQRRTF